MRAKTIMRSRSMHFHIEPDGLSLSNALLSVLVGGMLMLFESWASPLITLAIIILLYFFGLLANRYIFPCFDRWLANRQAKRLPPEQRRRRRTDRPFNH